MELQVKNLTKYYGKTLALDHLSVTLTEGVHGILGPNGAGKSTWMNLLRIVNLAQDADEKMRNYSGGMKQQILLAQALLGDPKILILAEQEGAL